MVRVEASGAHDMAVMPYSSAAQANSLCQDRAVGVGCLRALTLAFGSTLPLWLGLTSARIASRASSVCPSDSCSQISCGHF